MDDVNQDSDKRVAEIHAWLFKQQSDGTTRAQKLDVMLDLKRSMTFTGKVFLSIGAGVLAWQAFRAGISDMFKPWGK